MNFFNIISVDKRQNVSPQVQLMNQIRLAIYDYQLVENSHLPTIQDISQKFMIPIKDVDSALESLVQEGLLKPFKKSVYEVIYKKQSNELMAKAFLLYQYIKKLRLEPSIVTLVQSTIQADEWLAKKMNIALGEKIVYLKRIYYGNQKPIVQLESYLSVTLMPEAENIKFTNQPHFEVLIKYHQLEPHRSVRENRVILLNKDQAKALQDMEGSPCHQVEVWTYEKGGKLTDYNIATLPSNDVFETETKALLIQSIL